MITEQTEAVVEMLATQVDCISCGRRARYCTCESATVRLDDVAAALDAAELSGCGLCHLVEDF